MEQEIRDIFGDSLQSFSSYAVTLSNYDKRHDNTLQDIITKNEYKIVKEIGGLDYDEYTILYSKTI